MREARARRKARAPENLRRPEKGICMEQVLLCTIGHSDRPIAEFIDLLRRNEVECVLDIRTIPKSRHNPQFNRDTLPATLAAAGIGYRHLAGLGGLRHARADSANTGWRNASFRGFADYMQTAEF